MQVGDWTARVWTEDVRESSIMWTKYHKYNLTDAAWSPIRPGVFFTTKMNGTMDVWDITSKQKDPVLSMQVCDEALYSLRVHEHGRFVACGSQNGTVNILELAEPLHTQQPNEKNVISAIFERETRREKILEARHREMKLKEKVAKGGAEGAEGGEAAPADGEKNRDELIQQAEQEFWKALEQEKKQREKDEVEREKRAERQRQEEEARREEQEKADDEDGEAQQSSGEDQNKGNENNEQSNEQNNQSNESNQNGEQNGEKNGEQNGEQSAEKTDEEVRFGHQQVATKTKRAIKEVLERKTTL